MRAISAFRNCVNQTRTHITLGMPAPSLRWLATIDLPASECPILYEP